LEILKKTMF